MSLRSFRAPEEDAALERAWDVVRAAYRTREPVAAPRRRARPLVLVAATLAVVAAAAATAPGEAVLTSLRKAIGVEHAAPALFRLPAGGALLVRSDSGPWLVHSNG